MSRSSASPEAASGLPTWMRWGGAGLTALLAVLFVVVLLQVRGQSQRMQTLQDRIQSLENTQDLERTNALEEQLRSTVQRLQNLEGIEQTLDRLSSEQENLRLQIRSAGRRSSGSGSDSLDLQPLLPAEPPPVPPTQP